VSIDFHLTNFPTLSQNHEDTGHQYPDVNAGMDCVPTSIAAALTWFTGTQYYGDEIIDQVGAYGPTYTGGTAAVNFESYCAQRGVSLFPVDGSPAQLVAAIHSQLHLNRPVLVTVPGQWNNPATSGQNPGNVTHVMVVCGDGPGSIEVMNPWTGAFEEYSDSWFEVKVCYGQIWPMEGHMIPDGWTDDGTVLTAPNGMKIDTGMRTYILETYPRSHGVWPRENVPLAPEHTLAQISSADPSLGGGTRIDFLYWSLGWSRSKNAIGFMQVGTEQALASAQPPVPPATDAKAAAAKAALQAWLAE
jgi:hypothetical protein